LILDNCSVINGGVAECGRRPKIHHTNTQLRPMALPLQASLQKLSMAVDKKSTTLFGHMGKTAFQYSTN